MPSCNQKHVNGNKEPTSLRRLGKTETRAVYVEMAVRVRQGRSVPSSPGLPSDKRTPGFAAPLKVKPIATQPQAASDSSIVRT